MRAGNARTCAFYFRPRELLLVEMFPKIVNLLNTMDDVEDAVPPGIRLAKRRLTAFFAARLAKLEHSRAAIGAMQASGGPALRYGEAGECSAAKTQRLLVQDASGQPGLVASFSCRALDTWLTSHLLPSGASYSSLFPIVYLGRGVTPCQPDRTRCILNSGDIVDMLDSVGLLLSSQLAGELHDDWSTSYLAPSRRGRGCVHVNHELNTHTFLESVDIMRSASMIVSVQGSQNYNLLFASSSAIFIEMVPFNGERRAESNRIFFGSLGLKTAILPIPGFHLQDPTPFAINLCSIVRLIDQTRPIPHVSAPVSLSACCAYIISMSVSFCGVS